MRSNWIICGSLLLTKFIAFLENISPSLIFDKKRKHPNKYKNIPTSDNFYQENSSLLWKIGRYVCSPEASRRYQQKWKVCIIIYYYCHYYYYNYDYIIICYLLLIFRILYYAPLNSKKKQKRSQQYQRCGKNLLTHENKSMFNRA